MLHGITEFGGVWAESPLHFMQGMSHCIHSIHNKHDLGLLLVVGAVDGEVFFTSLSVRFPVLQVTLEFLLPEVLEPGVALVVVRAETLEVPVKLFNRVGSELQGDGPGGDVLVALDDALLRAPAVAGDPGEGHVEAVGGRDELPGVITSHEEHHHPGVGLLEQLPDHAIIGLPDVGPPHLLGGGDADVAQASLLLEGLDARLAVVSLGSHRGHVSPVEEPQDFSHGFGLVEVWGHGPCEVIVAGFVAQLGAGGGVADLGDLEESEQICHLETKRVAQVIKEGYL